MIADGVLFAVGAFLGSLAHSAWAGDATIAQLLPWDHLLVCIVAGMCGGMSSTLGAMHSEGSRIETLDKASARRALIVRALYDLIAGAVIGAVVVSASVRLGLTILEMLGLSIVGGMGGGRVAERMIIGVLGLLDKLLPAQNQSPPK